MATTSRNIENPDVPRSIAVPASTGIVPGPEVAASPSDPMMLRRLYSTMLRCRMVEERIEQLAQSQKLMLPVNLQRGLEATVIGSMIELRPGDAISSELTFATRIVSGEPLGLIFAGLYGMLSEYLAFAPEAPNSPIHLLPAAQTIGAQMNFAAGYALAKKKEQASNVVVLLLPEASNALGYWHEAATIAASERLPMIFVVVSSMRPTAMGRNDARQCATAYGIPGITVDGGDVVAMWRVAQESIHRARAGSGPTLINSQPPTPQPEGGDPLDRMQHYLDKRKLWKRSWKEELAQRFAVEIDEAQAFFLKTSEPQ